MLFRSGIHYNQNNDVLDYLQDPKVFQFNGGYVDRLKQPGLGIEINEVKVREMAAKGHDWKNIIWRNIDGSISEW